MAVVACEATASGRTGRLVVRRRQLGGAQMPLLRGARSWKDMCLRCTALVMRHVCLWLCDCPYTLCDQSSVPRGLLGPSPKYTHTRSHVRGVRECLMWVIDCLDAARWVTDGWRWKDANTRQGRQAGLRPQPPPRLINPLYCRQWGNRGGGSCCPEALHDFLAFLCPSANVNRPCISTINPETMGRDTIRILLALSDISRHN